tara:strand:- start:20384 stop:20560 length:177 start_codon:yes stop_codon:yes gene_type:complete
MSKIIAVCKSCNVAMQITRTFKKCTNLGCLEYNKRIRRRIASKQIRKEKEIQLKKKKD